MLIASLILFKHIRPDDLDIIAIRIIGDAVVSVITGHSTRQDPADPVGVHKRAVARQTNVELCGIQPRRLPETSQDIIAVATNNAPGAQFFFKDSDIFIRAQDNGI